MIRRLANWFRFRNRKTVRIYVCSPFRGEGGCETVRKLDEEHNCRFVESICCSLARLDKRITVFAPHRFFPLFLSDTVHEERWAGINSGLDIMSLFDEVWFVLPAWRRIPSEGMRHELEAAQRLGKRVILAYDPALYLAAADDLRNDLAVSGVRGRLAA